MNSSNTTRDMTQTSRYDEVNIPVVAEVVGASENDEQIPNQPPDPPVEVFTTAVSNVLEWSVAQTLTKDSKLFSVVVEKIYSRFGEVSAAGGSDTFGIAAGVSDLKFSRHSPKNPDSLYLNVVVISPSPRLAVTKKICLCNYNENDQEDEDK